MHRDIAGERLQQALTKALQKHPTPFHSAHEGLAIIEEEFLELQKAVFWGNSVQVQHELEQLGAMCLRFLMERYE